jgi:dienelactone hydrolase
MLAGVLAISRRLKTPGTPEKCCKTEYRSNFMAITTRTIEYAHDGVTFEALAAWDEGKAEHAPIVLVAGTFMGRTAFEDGKARKLAELGYVAVAIDVYGVETRPANFDEAAAAMTAINADRGLLRDRLLASLAAARGLGVGDSAKVAAIGFCFGGKCVLDLARAGADLLGVVSFHGVFDAPPFPNVDKIEPKILVLHGWDDPIAKPDAAIALAEELTTAGADWQIHAYGHVVHGFTNPGRPNMYNPVADARSWQAMQNFLAEIF